MEALWAAADSWAAKESFLDLIYFFMSFSHSGKTEFQEGENIGSSN